MRPKNLDKESAIRTVALQIIADEGLENLSMQKLAKAANVSPRTIYIKYKDKEDFLIKLYIHEVLGAYEAAMLKDFDPSADFAVGVQKLWQNAFAYLTENRHAFALIQYGKTSPLLNRSFQEADIKEGQFFAPILHFFQQHMADGIIPHFPHDVLRAMLFAPAMELIKEYFDHRDRPVQIITPEVWMTCCHVVIKGILL